MIKFFKTNKIITILFIGGIIGVILLVIPKNKKERNFQRITIESVVKVDAQKELSDEEKLTILLEDNKNNIDFYSNTFQISSEILTNKIKENYLNLNLLDSENNFDRILLDYLLILESDEKELFDRTKMPCNYSKEYIVALINYFSNLYDNVDYSIAAGIAQVESGFTAQYMLYNNNVFGGMAGGRLISYRNIEYGILNYIKLLSEGYFSKGLNTIESIGSVYNPTYNESGVKVAKPSWVNNVTKASLEYLNREYVDINVLNSLKSY